MTYTQEMKQQINKAGMQVIEFKKIMRDIEKAFEKMFEAIKKIADVIAKCINSLFDEIKEYIRKLNKMPPKQRYKECKRLGIKNYECLFYKKPVYKARSNC